MVKKPKSGSSCDADETRRNNGRASQRKIRTFEVPRPETLESTSFQRDGIPANLPVFETEVEANNYNPEAHREIHRAVPLKELYKGFDDSIFYWDNPPPQVKNEPALQAAGDAKILRAAANIKDEESKPVRPPIGVDKVVGEFKQTIKGPALENREDIERYLAGLGVVGAEAVELVPVIGDAIGLVRDSMDLYDAVNEGDPYKGSAAAAGIFLDIAGLAADLLPGAGTAAGTGIVGVKKAIRAAGKKYSQEIAEKAAKEAAKMAGETGTKKILTPTDRLKAQLLERPGKDKTQTTLNAAKRELGGEKTGFDHVTKVENAQRGLLNRIDDIRKQLGKQLTPQERTALESELGEASRLLDLSERFVPRK